MNTGLKKVLIVDDEPGVRDSLKLLLKSNFEVNTAQDGREALEIIKSFGPDIVLLDVMMPRLDGMQTLRHLREDGFKKPVIMLTAANTVKTAVQAMKLGAIDYLNKPFDVEEITSLIVETLDSGDVEERSGSVASEVPEIPQQELPEADFGPMVGSSDAMKEVFRKVELVAKKDTTVLITGESGTGKELIARQIHQLSPRKDKPFIAINCAAIPETLIESELFGHERGSFTSAVDQRVGHFELANGGTLFLDEIGELSMPVQVKMLRFLQEQEFYRVGSSKPQRVDVRVITATNTQLEELIKDGRFRQDLYYRIHVINVPLPPLRDRFEDIPHLVKHFIDKFAPTYGEREMELSKEAVERLVQYEWPGNVRELENVVESLMALAVEDTIKEEDLPPKIKSSKVDTTSKESESSEGLLNFEDAERRFETEMILKALKKTNFVQVRAAELLGISRRILKYKMDKLGISDMLDKENNPDPKAEKVSNDTDDAAEPAKQDVASDKADELGVESAEAQIAENELVENKQGTVESSSEEKVYEEIAEEANAPE